MRERRRQPCWFCMGPSSIGSSSVSTLGSLWPACSCLHFLLPQARPHLQPLPFRISIRSFSLSFPYATCTDSSEFSSWNPNLFILRAILYLLQAGVHSQFLHFKHNSPKISIHSPTHSSLRGAYKCLVRAPRFSS